MCFSPKSRSKTVVFSDGKTSNKLLLDMTVSRIAWQQRPAVLSYLYLTYGCQLARLWERAQASTNVTVEREYEVVYGLSNCVFCNDLKVTPGPWPGFQGRGTCQKQISQDGAFWRQSYYGPLIGNHKQAI